MQVLARQIPMFVVIARLVRAIHGMLRRRMDHRDKPGGDDNLRVVDRWRGQL